MNDGDGKERIAHAVDRVLSGDLEGVAAMLGCVLAKHRNLLEQFNRTDRLSDPLGFAVTHTFLGEIEGLLADIQTGFERAYQMPEGAGEQLVRRLCQMACVKYPKFRFVDGTESVSTGTDAG